ncbi:hypothetical protein [Desulforamulus aeronauticus]|uniref:Transcription factor zinc-finger domain-containing protein n=1 Tax=Desulforamulus aeronauticus DSM 10349 TaxID=1121421 RepID=A0A1M6SD52_9FIRM|nr:hypothetical protein [Desulforamulus aeronauticus]SHK42640.1 hypothetical protein SAMN02745123_01818 [Desulforamulus aeronauticus DSM 10349]
MTCPRCGKEMKLANDAYYGGDNFYCEDCDIYKAADDVELDLNGY